MTSLAEATAAGSVTAVRPDGVAVTLPASSVDRALELGYRIEDAAGTAARKRHEEYGTASAELGSAALGAARGLTFGLSDVALRQTGALTPEKLRAYQEESPTASTLGEYGGIAAGVLTPGAIGRVLGSGIRGAAAVGDLAAGALNAGTKAVGMTGRAGLTGIALDALAGGASGVARGAAEGAVFGVGQGVSNLAARDENELGHPAELAQVLAAHAGMGALLGGAISGTIGGATTLGTSAAKRMLRALGTDSGAATLAAAKDAATAPATADVHVPEDILEPKPADAPEPVPDKPKPPTKEELATPVTFDADPEEGLPAFTISHYNEASDEKTMESLVGNRHPDPNFQRNAENFYNINNVLESHAKGTALDSSDRRAMEAFDNLAARTTLDQPSIVTIGDTGWFERQADQGNIIVRSETYQNGQLGDGPRRLQPVDDRPHVEVEVRPGQRGIITDFSDMPQHQGMARMTLPRDQTYKILSVSKDHSTGRKIIRAVALVDDSGPSIYHASEFGKLDIKAQENWYKAHGMVDPNSVPKSKGDAVYIKSEPVEVGGGTIDIPDITASDLQLINQHQTGRIRPSDPAWHLSKEMRRGKLLPDVQAWRDSMDKLMSRSKVTKELTLYRGVDTSSWGANIKVGSTIGDQQFQSFTTSETTARHFSHSNALMGQSDDSGAAIIQIKLVPGDHALPVGEISKKIYAGEREVLLPRDTTYRVTSIIRGVESGGKSHRVIQVEPVPRAHIGSADVNIPLEDHIAAKVFAAKTDAPSKAQSLRDMALRLAGGTVANVASVTSGVDDTFMRELLQPGPKAARMREIAVDGEEALTQHTRNIDKVLTHIEDNSHAVMTGTLGDLKADRIRELTKKGVFAQQMQGAQDIVEKADTFIKKYQAKQFAGGYKAGLRTLRVDTEALKEKLAIAARKPDDGGDVFIAVDQYKRLVGALARPGVGLRAAEAPIVRAIRDDLYNGTLQPFLEDTSLWGDAGTAQARINRLWVNLLDKKRQFNSAFLTEHGRDPATEFWQQRQVADPAKVFEFLRNVSHVKNDLKRSILTEQIDAASEFAKAAKEIYAFRGKTANAADAIIDSAGTARKTIDQALEDARVRNLGKQLSGTSTGRVLTILQKLDQAVGVGPEVRAELRAELRRAAARIGKGQEGPEHAERLASAVEDIRTEQVRQAELGNVGRAVRGTIRAFAAAVDRSVAITETGERIATPIAIAEGKRYALSLPTGDGTDDDDNEKGAGAELKRRLRSLHRFSGDPSKLYAAVHDSTRGVAAVAPQTAAELAALAGTAVNHLESVAPRQNSPGLYRAADGTWAPTTAEAMAFDASLRAVLHPLSVADDLADGTLTRPGVTALKTVYPGLHDMIAAMLAVRLQQAKNVPLQRRIQLSALFDLPTDGATDPGFAAMIQQGYAAPSAQPAAPHGGAFSQQDRAQMRRNVATATQRIG